MTIKQLANGLYELTQNNQVLATNLENERVAQLTKEYYQGKENGYLIELEKVLTDQQLLVKTENTTFTKRSNVEKINKDDLLQRFKQVNDKMKANNIETKGYIRVRKFVNENYENYLKEVEQYQSLYETLKNGWIDYNLAVGYSCDYYYNNVLQKAEFALQKMTYRNTLLSRFTEFESNLTSFIELDLEHLGGIYYSI